MKAIGLIFNPNANPNKKNPEAIKNHLETILGKNGIVYQTNSDEEIPRALDELRRNNIAVLGISGGDGTISRVLSEYISIYGENDLPIIAPLKGGTMNMIVADAVLNAPQTTVCRALSEAAGADRPIPTVERGMLKISIDKSESPAYCFCWMDGYLYKFLQTYYTEVSSPYTALKLIYKSIIATLLGSDDSMLNEISSTVRLDDVTIENRSHLFLLASSLERLVFRFRPFVTKPKPGSSFNVMYVRRSVVLRTIYKLPKYLYGGVRSRVDGTFLNQSAKRISVEGNHGYVMDGELYLTDSSLNITIQPGPVLNMFSLSGPH